MRASSSLAEAVRAACVAAARDAHEDAGLRGLCAEGRWEAAIHAMASLDVTTVVAEYGKVTSSR